jgi:predicted DNA-binding protein
MTRLTISLSDELRRRAKAAAALRGESLSDAIRAFLEKYIADAMEEAEDIQAIREIEARIASGEERLYSHQEVWDEIDALEAQGALPD